MTQKRAIPTDPRGRLAGAAEDPAQDRVDNPADPLLLRTSLLDLSPEAQRELEALVQVLVPGLRRLTRRPAASPGPAAILDALGADLEQLRRAAASCAATAGAEAVTGPCDVVTRSLDEILRELAAARPDEGVR